MKKFKDFIEESSLSRVWQHAKSDKIIAILTGFRDENIRADNLSNNKYIAATLKNNGFGYFYVNGFWIENQGKENEIHVKEDSIFAIAPKERGDEFRKLVVKLGKKFKQDAVLVKYDDGSFHLLDKFGWSTATFKSLNANSMARAYTQLRNNKKSNTFVFESTTDGIGFVEHLKDN